MYFHKPQEKPRRWGSFQDVQYAVMKNCEKIYNVDPNSIVLAMPLFWGLPALDYSGKNNHGTNHGATYKDGSLDFDGTDYVQTKNATVNYANGLTFIARIYPTTTSQNKDIISHRDQVDGELDGATLFRIDDGKLVFGIYDIGWKYALPDLAISTNTWAFISIVYNGDTAVFTINSSTETEAFNYLNPNINEPFTIAKHGISLSNRFLGRLAEVHAAKTAYTAEQTALFHNRPWALYQPVSRPVYFFMATGEEPSPGPGLMALMV